ncbi:MAG TPA: kelch repeat-containing protein [bacterium]|nr:kelch repeat-containing protein [bacterium]HMW33278.1 kelch repeat-containing protein [bacterium]HMW35963.1 kelch repeat-containing protein [bacterium]HMZ05142.1 kelch repeat-containing protein [bacterium]HNB09180.1 kelch repeat-containing protein [bacterium]
MKRMLLIATVILMACDGGKSDEALILDLTDFPLPLAASTAAIYNGELYVFGGSDNYNGDTTYQSIFKFNGSSWETVDTMFNDATWDGKVLIKENFAYYVSGWPDISGALKRYNFTTKTWTGLDTGGIGSNWGTTAQIVGNKIYHFDSYGEVEVYDMNTNQWLSRNPNGLKNGSERGLTSVVHDGNIFVTGYGDTVLYKYHVDADSFSVESVMPRSITSCVMVELENKIYFIGGSENDEEAYVYSDSYIYDITEQEWTHSSIALKTPSIYTAYVLSGSTVYVIGGINASGDGITDAYKISLK